MNVLETTGLTRAYGKLIAVRELTMAVERGEAFGLLGPNGAGKSTAIKMLTTLLPPTSGKATVAGFDITSQAAYVRRSIGYVPQALSVDGSLSGYENLLLFAKLYDIPRRLRESRLQKALALVGLTEAADKLVRQYSGGMIRRLEIAQSTLHRPPLLFLDEPTVGLDPLARQAVWGHIRQLRNDYGTTIFLTTHDMQEADHLCSRIAIMHLGRLVITDTPKRLKEAIGKPDASLGDVFIHYAGDSLESGSSYSETSRGRRRARRLG